jgi:hypothetical protein
MLLLTNFTYTKLIGVHQVLHRSRQRSIITELVRIRGGPLHANAAEILLGPARGVRSAVLQQLMEALRDQTTLALTVSCATRNTRILTHRAW